jgi:PDZ domain-containing protein
MSKRYGDNRYWVSSLIAIILFSVIYFFPLPYYIYKPGTAVELAPIITVENGYPEQGTFMLTTVRREGASIIGYGLAKWDDYKDIVSKETILAHYKDEQEFYDRQIQVMQSSQESAILVAYELANLPVNVSNHGIMVVQTVDDMPARKYFEFGDIITRIDGLDLSTSEELVSYVQDKEMGESVEITFLRKAIESTVTIQLAPFPLSEDEKAQDSAPRAGIGISTITDRKIEVDPPVHINTNRIGGPSAGFMFALEIYNQLTEKDITKGYRIAGTGTINTDGIVGRIGGVHQKIVAADNAKADIFFAPHEKGAADSNYEIAVKTAQDIDTAMKVVPIDTIQDALDYLENLPQKKGK